MPYKLFVAELKSAWSFGVVLTCVCLFLMLNNKMPNGRPREHTINIEIICRAVKLYGTANEAPQLVWTYYKHVMQLGVQHRVVEPNLTVHVCKFVSISFLLGSRHCGSSIFWALTP